MNKVRALIAIAGFAIAGAAGCAEPGVINVAPVMGTAGAASSAAPIGAAATMAPPPAGAGGVSAPPQAGTVGAGGSIAAGSGGVAAGAGGATAGSGGAAAGSNGSTAGAGGNAAGAGGSEAAGAGGTAAGAGGSAAGAGGSTPPAPGPCPSGWDCTDLSSLGVTAVDGAGNPVTYSCGNGALADCDDANPGATCAPLTAPFCAHLNVAGMDLISCGQRCTP